MSDHDAQRDEILAIKSIFQSDALFVNAACRRGVFIASPVLTDSLIVSYSSRREDNGPLERFSIDYLLPFEFQFELPDSYPSKDPPKFLLSCEWLSAQDLRKVCYRLDKLWNETRSEILYQWFDFLLHELITFLEIRSPYSIADEVLEPGEYESGKFNRLCPGVIIKMQRYDSTKRKERFENSKIECGICFLSVFGRDTVAFGCDHYYCSNCIKTYLETSIANCQVHSLVCPFDICNSTVDPEMVKALVGPDLYQKYDSILLSSAIENLEGTFYCPRVNCLKPIITINGLHIEQVVQCPYCDFVFCTNCKKANHGVDPCKSFADENEKLIVLTKYDEAGPEKKKLMEAEYGKKFLFQQLQDFKNKTWLKDNSKQCPRCAYSIQKIEGCNKMRCFRCNCNFCWLCLAELRGDNPYLHFSDQKSACFEKLFQGVIQDDEWE